MLDWCMRLRPHSLCLEYMWHVQFDIMTAVADVRQGHIDIQYKGEHQTLTNQCMRQHVCLDETCHATISESAMTMVSAQLSKYKIH